MRKNGYANLKTRILTYECRSEHFIPVPFWRGLKGIVLKTGFPDGHYLRKVDVNPPHLITTIAGQEYSDGPYYKDYSYNYDDITPAKYATFSQMDMSFDNDDNLIILAGIPFMWDWIRVYKLYLHPIAPPCPQNIRAFPRTVGSTDYNATNRYRIDWNPPADVSGVDKYNVYKKKQSDADWTLLTSLDETGLSQYVYRDFGIDDCETYCYKVVSVNANGVESEGCTEPPCWTVPPADVVCNEPVIDKVNGLVTFSWAHPCASSIKEFIVTVNGAEEARVPATETSYTLTVQPEELDCGNIYTFGVRSVALKYPYDKSNLCEKTKEFPDTEPPTIPECTAERITGTTQLKVTWAPSTDNCGLAGYKVNGVDVGDVTEYVVDAGTAINCPGTFCFTVGAYDASGNLVEPGTPCCYESKDETPPDVPSFTSVTALNENEILLAWDPAADECEGAAAGYYIGYTLDGANVVADVKGTAFTATGLSPCTEYCFTISAYDSSGNVSGTGEESCVKTPFVLDTNGGITGECGSPDPININSELQFSITLTHGANKEPITGGITLTPTLYYQLPGGGEEQVDFWLKDTKVSADGTWTFAVKNCLGNAGCPPFREGTYSVRLTAAPADGDNDGNPDCILGGFCGCGEIRLDSLPACTFSLVDNGGNGGGNGGGNAGGNGNGNGNGNGGGR